MKARIGGLGVLALLACSNGAAAPRDAGSAVDAGAAEASVDVPPADAGPSAFQVFDRVRIASRDDQPNFHRARASFNLGNGPFARVTMIIDLATTCYPFENWRTNRPPAGQVWPADCDAFDRNFEFILDAPASAEGRPGVELLRAITPFGGPLHHEVDVTDIFNGLPGEHTLMTVIPTYSDGAGRVSGSNGGWNVSARFVVERGPAPRRVLAVTPLYDLSHTPDTPDREYAFTTPPGTAHARIEYRVTGHGGGAVERPACIGPAEEFCVRTHTLSVDDAEVDTWDPWRNDCRELCTLVTNDAGIGPSQYCQENPCGAVQSVRAPRANWCPGSVTPPHLIEDAALLTPGPHRFRYRISRVAASGLWRTSAVFIATE